MSLGLQARLLRVLQEKAFERVGGTRQIVVDVRVVAATNQDLERLVREGRFREDLYYRLNGCEVVLLPLRDRPADIPVFAPPLHQPVLSRVRPRAARRRARVHDRPQTICLAGQRPRAQADD